MVCQGPSTNSKLYNIWLEEESSTDDGFPPLQGVAIIENPDSLEMQSYFMGEGI